MTTYRTGNAIGSADPRDLYDNAENLDEAVNSDSYRFTDRLGRLRPTLKGAIDPTGLASSAAASAQQAETARDAAFVNADVYPDIATGRAAVANGEQFQVVFDDIINRYRKVSESESELVASYPASDSVNSIWRSANDLFLIDEEVVFPAANLAVRRYVGGDPVPMPVGSYQHHAPDGLRLIIPAVGTASTRNWFLTGKSVSLHGRAEVIFSDVSLEEFSSLGIGYVAHDGTVVAVGYSFNGVVREFVDGQPSTNISSGNRHIIDGDTVLFRSSLGVVEIYINNDLIYSHIPGWQTSINEICLFTLGHLEAIARLYISSDPIREYIKAEFSESAVSSYNGFYYYNGLDRFTVYSHLTGAIYVGFNIVHEIDTSDELFIDYWRVVDARFFMFTGTDMAPTGFSALASGENECVIRRPGKDDASGGYHGDEQMQDVQFFADGVEIKNLSEPIALTPCNNFYYLIQSTIHEAPEGGEPIPGHPLECEHIKKTTIEGGGYETFNRLIWVRPGEVSRWYHGVSCIHKDTASEGYTEHDFDTAMFTGSGDDDVLLSATTRNFYANNSTTGYSAEATSRLMKPDGVDEDCDIFIWDRSSDSKYYRRMPGRDVDVGDVWESHQKVTFGAMYRDGEES